MAKKRKYHQKKRELSRYQKIYTLIGYSIGDSQLTKTTWRIKDRFQGTHEYARDQLKIEAKRSIRRQLQVQKKNPTVELDIYDVRESRTIMSRG